MVANKGVEKRDNEVEDHQRDEPFPKLLHDGGICLHLVKLSLGFEHALFLFIHKCLDSDCMAREILEEVHDDVKHVLGEGYHDEDDLDGDFINGLANQGWDEESEEGDLEVAAHETGQVEQRIRDLTRIQAIAWLIVFSCTYRCHAKYGDESVALEENGQLFLAARNPVFFHLVAIMELNWTIVLDCQDILKLFVDASSC